MLEQFYEKNKIEAGIDEAGRGCLFGPVCIASVIWLDEDPIDGNLYKDYKIIDSKKCSDKKKNILKDYIKDNSIAYDIQLINNNYIDKHNILESTIHGMHKCLDNITDIINIDNILVDGNSFNMYENKNGDMLSYICVIDGDNKYKSIAAASILAKTYRDEYIKNLVEENPELKLYDIHNNKGYGTKKHIEAIKKYGITKWHRKSFGICKKYN